MCPIEYKLRSSRGVYPDSQLINRDSSSMQRKHLYVKLAKKNRFHHDEFYCQNIPISTNLLGKILFEKMNLYLGIIYAQALGLALPPFEFGFGTSQRAI